MPTLRVGIYNTEVITLVEPQKSMPACSRQVISTSFFMINYSFIKAYVIKTKGVHQHTPLTFYEFTFLRKPSAS